MMATGSTRNIERLVAIKREALDEFRQDVVRLNDIVDAVDQRFRQALENSKQFLAETISSETRGNTLDAEAMIGARRYLHWLQDLAVKISQELEQAKARHAEAASLLENAFTEVRALERLLERRQRAKVLRQSRTDYFAADDQEICRVAQCGGNDAGR